MSSNSRTPNNVEGLAAQSTITGKQEYVKSTSGALNVTGTFAVTQSTSPWVVAGPTASGATLTANPLTIGGLAKTAEPTSVTDGQAVNALFSKSGKQITAHALTEMRGNQNTTITSSTGETTIVTANATYLLDLYGITVANTSSTFTKVTIKDATSGTTRFIWSIPSQDMRGFMLPASDGHKQAVVNNNWTLTCGTSVASVEVTALFNQRL